MPSRARLLLSVCFGRGRYHEADQDVDSVSCREPDEGQFCAGHAEDQLPFNEARAGSVPRDRGILAHLTAGAVSGHTDWLDGLLSEESFFVSIGNAQNRLTQTDSDSWSCASSSCDGVDTSSQVAAVLAPQAAPPSRLQTPHTSPPDRASVATSTPFQPSTPSGIAGRLACSSSQRRDSSGAASAVSAGILPQNRDWAASAQCSSSGSRGALLWTEPQELLRGGRWPRGERRGRVSSASGRPCSQPVWEEENEELEEQQVANTKAGAADPVLPADDDECCGVFNDALISTTSVQLSQSPRQHAAASAVSSTQGLKPAGQQQQQQQQQQQPAMLLDSRRHASAAKPPCPRSQSLSGPSARPQCPRSYSLTGPSAARRLLSLFGGGGGGAGASGGVSRQASGSASAATATAAAAAVLRSRRCGSEGTNENDSSRASVEAGPLSPAGDAAAAATKPAVSSLMTSAGLVSGQSPLLLPAAMPAPPASLCVPSPPRQDLGQQEQQEQGRYREPGLPGLLPAGPELADDLEALFEGLEGVRPHRRCCDGGGGSGCAAARPPRRHTNMVVFTGKYEERDVIVKIAAWDPAAMAPAAADSSAAAGVGATAAPKQQLCATATAARLAAAGHPNLAPILALRVATLDEATAAALAAEAAAAAAEAAAVTPVSLASKAPSTRRGSSAVSRPPTPGGTCAPAAGRAAGSSLLMPLPLPAAAACEIAVLHEEPPPTHQQQPDTLPLAVPSISSSIPGGGGGFGSCFVAPAVQLPRNHHEHQLQSGYAATAAAATTAIAGASRQPHKHQAAARHGAGDPLRRSLDLPARLGHGSSRNNSVAADLLRNGGGGVVSAAAAAASLWRASASTKAFAPQLHTMLQQPYGGRVVGAAAAANKAADPSAAMAAAVTGVPDIELTAPPPPPPLLSRGNSMLRARATAGWSPVSAGGRVSNSTQSVAAAAAAPQDMLARSLGSAPVSGTAQIGGEAGAAAPEAEAAAVAAWRLYPRLAGLRLHPGACVMVVMTEKSELGSLATVACSPSSPFAPRPGWSAYRAQRALLATALEVAAGLAALHAAGAAHGALQPSNVLLFLTATANSAIRDPRGFTAKLADIGAASATPHLRQPAPPAANLLFQAPEVLSPPPSFETAPSQPPDGLRTVQALPQAPGLRGGGGMQSFRGGVATASGNGTGGRALNGGRLGGGSGEGATVDFTRPSAPAATACAAGSPYSTDTPAGALFSEIAGAHAQPSQSQPQAQPSHITTRQRCSHASYGGGGCATAYSTPSSAAVAAAAAAAAAAVGAIAPSGQPALLGMKALVSAPGCVPGAGDQLTRPMSGPASGSAGARSRLEALLLTFLSAPSPAPLPSAGPPEALAAAGSAAVPAAATVAASAAASTSAAPSLSAAGTPKAWSYATCNNSSSTQAPATGGLRNFLSRGSSRFRQAAMVPPAVVGDASGGRSFGSADTRSRDATASAAGGAAGSRVAAPLAAAQAELGKPPPALMSALQPWEQRCQHEPQARQRQQELAAVQAADIWSFGLLLYTAAAGQLPFQGQHLVQTLVRVAGEGLRPEWPGGGPHALLRPLYAACTARQPADRPSMAMVFSELKQLEHMVRDRSRRRRQQTSQEPQKQQPQLRQQSAPRAPQ